MAIIVPGSFEAGAPSGALVQQAQLAAESVATWAVRVLLTGILFVALCLREEASGDHVTLEERQRRATGQQPQPGPFRLSFGRAKELLEMAAIWSGLVVDCTIAEVRARMAQAQAEQQPAQ